MYNFSASTARPKNFKEIYHPVQQNLKNVSIQIILFLLNQFNICSLKLVLIS